ncbi:MAG: DUF5596 domain-containing protein [Clostridia bacterium]|nr:DUF5596 domain-containing protein [Clostridia bacterium]
MYYTREYLSSLATKIRMLPEALDAVLTHFDTFSPVEAEEIARFLADTSCFWIKKCQRINEIAQRENGDLLCVLLYMAAAGYTFENYKKMDIPDCVFYDSFNCLSEKMETAKRFTGRWGCLSVHWPARITSMQTFRIGRLSYAMEFASDAILENDKVLVEKGAPYIHIHIPDNDKLCGCEESVKTAREFFAKFYPEYKNAVFYTRAWLLDPRLSEILPEDSNIMQFQKVFHIFGHIDGEEAILSRVFGHVKENLDEYKPTSSLARGVLSYIKSGKRLGSGMGYTRF